MPKKKDIHPECVQELVSEEDFPFDHNAFNNTYSWKSETKKIDTRLSKKITKDEWRKYDTERKEKKYYTAFKLIVGCLGLLIFVYYIDILANLFYGKQLSKMTGNVIEIIKTMLFTLSGYLFGRKGSGKD